MRRIDGWVGLVVALALTACGTDSVDSDADASVPTVQPTEPIDEGAVTTPPASESPTSTDQPGTPTSEPRAEGTVVADTPDVCAALDTVDLDGLLGEPAGAPESEVDAFGGSCTVPSLDPASRGSIAFRVTTNSAAENYENSRQQFGVDSEISDLGDAAFASGALVVVLSGDTLVTLQVVRWSELDLGPATQQDLEVAMREALMATGTQAAPDDGASAVDGSACSLLAGIDVASLIGEPVGEPTIEEDGARQVCEVLPIDSASSASVSLTVISSEAAQRFAETEEMFGVDSRVDDLGDDAFHSGPVLAVLSGDRAFVLWILGDILLGANIDDARMEAAMDQVLASAGG